MDWTDGLDYWTGLKCRKTFFSGGLQSLDWTSRLDWWTGLLDGPKMSQITFFSILKLLESDCLFI